MRILVVEDDRKVASFIQSGLQQEGHAVDVLDDGTDAGQKACAVGYDAVVIELKPKEFALLEFLMRHSDRPVTRSLIIEHVWDIHFDSISNVVEVHINSLRSKIDRGFAVPLIHTVRGVGYMLTDSQP